MKIAYDTAGEYINGDLKKKNLSIACNSFSKAFQCLEMVLPWAISLIRGSGGLGRKEAIIFGRSALAAAYH